MSAVEYVKMTVEDQVLAFEAINPAARYNLVVKHHPDGFKLGSLVRV